jgi:ATP-binding cassette subfamily B protein
MASVADEQPVLSNRDLIRRMLDMVWQHRLSCLRIVCLQVLLLGMGMLGLGLTGLGIDYLRSQLALKAEAMVKPPPWPFGWAPPVDWMPMRVLGCIAVAILLFAAIRALLNISYTILVNRFLQGQVVVDLRSRVFRKLQRLSFRFFDANASGAIINRVTGDVQAVRSFIDGVAVQSLILLLSLIVYLVYMMNIHVWLTLACLATTPAMWWITARFSRKVRPAYVVDRKLFDEQIRVLSENVQGVHVVKGFARQVGEIEKFNRAAEAFRTQKHWIINQVSRFRPVIGFLSQINLVVLLGYGGYLVIAYDTATDVVMVAQVGVSVGQLLVFAGLLQQFSGQVANISTIADSMQQSLTGAQRVFEILDAPIEIKSAIEAIALPRIRGEVTFDHVSFSYRPNLVAVEDVSFTVRPGQCVAILGATGSGKSTLLSLIPRFYDTSGGRVLVDGHDVRDIVLDDLRRSIGMVFQESFLFSNTIEANIAFGAPNETRVDVVKAARIAAAHDFIMAMPGGYDTVLREGGSNLSGGQRQRLAIARAILLDPAILLLDDPTAAIDSQTESEIMTAMNAAMKGRTTFLVAHRLSTLRQADQVLVLQGGRIVDAGTHDELMQKGGMYRRAARLQIPDQKSLELLGHNGSPDIA